jgi:hypothetical protein
MADEPLDLGDEDEDDPLPLHDDEELAWIATGTPYGCATAMNMLMRRKAREWAEELREILAVHESMIADLGGPERYRRSWPTPTRDTTSTAVRRTVPAR